MSSMIKNKWWSLFILFGIFIVLLYVYCYQTDVVCCIKPPNKTYTHIIVGAGTTGCVLAARLSENKNNRILLVEAGSHFNIISKIPMFATFLQKSAYDWSYKTEAQKWSSEGFFEKRQHVPRGKGLGGTGQMNFMITDVNENNIKNHLKIWKSIGALNISKNIVNFFKRLKNSDINSCKPVCKYQQYLFPKTNRNKSTCKLSTKSSYPLYLQKSKSYLGYVLQKAIVELQVNQLDYQPYVSTIYKGKRWSTYDSHLRQASNRHNLDILCRTEVTKIVFNNNRAVGIQTVDENSNRNIINITSEIILCAGAINTPKLLLLSGIGNSSELQKLNISPIADVPGVGLNMHDHFNTPLYVSIKEPISVTLDKIFRLQEIYNYIFNAKGILAEFPIAATAHISSNLSLILFAVGSTNENIFCTIANYLPSTFRGVFPLCNNYSQEGLVFLGSCAEPKSRGFVKLKSKRPTDPPIIDPQYLHDRYDVLCTQNAIQLISAIVNTHAFKDIGATIHWPQLEACKNYTANFTDHKYMECIIRTAGITGYHNGGTCKMGIQNDIYSVVDEKFRVKGISGLRVIDASILPTPASPFPNIILTAIAESAIDVL